MLVDIVMPKMGESIMEGTILEWRKKIGDKVEKDEIFLEIGTDKVDSEHPSPAEGVMAEILAEPNDVVDVGVVIARIETEGNVVAPEPEKPKPQEKESPVPEPKIQPVKPAAPKPSTGEKRFFTPVVNKIASEKGISMDELLSIQGTGKSGRVTKQDILHYIETGPEPISAPPKPARAEKQPTLFSQGEDRVEMDHMRKLIAEHMRKSLDTAAHVYVMTEVDMTPIVEAVKLKADDFYRKEGFSLTYTPYIVYALVKTLGDFPEMNAMLDGTTIINNRHINIGMAVAIEKGLMVPVIENCEELNFLGICRKIRDLAVRTRNKQINPDELQGATFSITNFGVFNVTMGMPIINQPNVGILGVGAVKKKPVVLESPEGDSIGIKSIMFLSLGFDHRLIDGAGGSRFIEAVRQNLEALNPENLF